jgi:hypothetical protein
MPGIFHGSRLYTRTAVGEHNYRWAISPDSGYVVFIAESADTPARKIEVYVDSDIDRMWVEFPTIEGPNLKVIKPKDAANIIEQAIEQGWNPMENGKPLVFDHLEGGSIVARKT